MPKNVDCFKSIPSHSVVKCDIEFWLFSGRLGHVIY